MAEYIDRERARFEAKRYFKNLDEIQEDLDMLFCMLPAADVAPVRHGRWQVVRKGDWTSVYKCSLCMRRETVSESDYYNSDVRVKELYPYCHCGAKMDGERKENENV